MTRTPWPQAARGILGLSFLGWAAVAVAITAARCEPAPSPSETLETIAMAATRPGRDPAATLAAIGEAATGPLSDQARLQVGAALADFVKIRGGVLPFSDQQRAAALFMNRLAANGVVLREAGR